MLFSGILVYPNGMPIPIRYSNSLVAIQDFTLRNFKYFHYKSVANLPA